MPLCVYDDSHAMFGATSVENLFLEEFMPRAPGDCVKVYLYGLKLCQNPEKEMSLSAVARALALDESQVQTAFSYWERKGVLRRLSDRPVQYAYVNLQKALLEGKLGGVSTDLPYQDFNNSLQDLFGDRLLHAEEYQRIYALMEDMELPKEVTLLLVEHMVETSAKKQKVGIAQIEKEARLWVKEGYTNREAALRYIHSKTPEYEGAKKVVQQLGQHRPPSLDEEALYQKWTGEWGFSLEAVLLACKETTKIGNPNFAYIDAVLRNRRQQNLLTPMQMLESEERRKEQMAGLRELLSSLGLPSTGATEDSLALYASWKKQGFDQEAMVLAAKYLLRQGRHSLQEEDNLLKSLKSHGLTTGAQVEAYFRKNREQTQALQVLFQAAGIRRKPTKADGEQYEDWKRRGASMDLLLLAAEYSRHGENPFAMMQKILSDWLAGEVKDVASAKQEHDQRQAAQAAGRANAGAQPRGPSAFNNYEQRQYSKEELEALYDDLDELLAQEDEQA